MSKHLELEFNSLGEMISMLRYNDHLTVADLQRPVKAVLDINTEGPIDGTYLHIGGPLMPEWFKHCPKDKKDPSGEGKEKTSPKTPSKRPIGFRMPETKALKKEKH